MCLQWVLTSFRFPFAISHLHQSRSTMVFIDHIRCYVNLEKSKGTWQGSMANGQFWKAADNIHQCPNQHKPQCKVNLVGHNIRCVAVEKFFLGDMIRTRIDGPNLAPTRIPRKVFKTYYFQKLKRFLFFKLGQDMK